MQTELQSGIIVRGRMQPPQLLHTNNRGTPARDTGVAGALNPVPADQTPGLASGPGWPLAPRPVLSQRTKRTWRSDRCSFVHDATHQQTQIFTGSAECLCVVGTKTGNEEHKQVRKCPWRAIYANFQVGIAPINRRLFYFATGGLTFVEMAICKIDTSFPLQQRQLLQARSLPLKPPHTICSSAGSVTATRRLRLREVHWANLGAMHCQSRPRLQVARQVDLGRFLARLDRFPLGPPGCSYISFRQRNAAQPDWCNLTPYLCSQTSLARPAGCKLARLPRPFTSKWPKAVVIPHAQVARTRAGSMT